MESYWASWLLLASVVAAACISPGPDFIMSVRNSLRYGRRAGIVTAIGFGLGAAVHAAYTLAGLGAVITQSILLFSVIRYAGAAYLIYLGIQALRSRGAVTAAIEHHLAGGQGISKTDLAALRDGFITNLFNPKATLFFLALFTQLIDPAMPVGVRFVFGATTALIVTGWFVAVACMMTLPLVRARYLALSRMIDRVLGVLLVGFGVRLALSR